MPHYGLRVVAHLMCCEADRLRDTRPAKEGRARRTIVHASPSLSAGRMSRFGGAMPREIATELVVPRAAWLPSAQQLLSRNIHKYVTFLSDREYS